MDAAFVEAAAVHGRETVLLEARKFIGTQVLTKAVLILPQRVVK